jgi:C-terminal processing protease CtpA/Prc
MSFKNIFFIAALLFSSMSYAENIVGVGLVLKTTSGMHYVEDFVPNSPAERLGLVEKGEQLIEVQVDVSTNSPWVAVTDMPLEKVVALIRGTEGTKVGLRFYGYPGIYNIVLVREKLAE